MRLNKAIILLALLCFSLATPQKASAVERAEIAAVVNDDIITTTDIQTRLRLNTGGRPIPQAERQIAYETVLDELINEVLQRQEAKDLSINIEDQQVRDTFSRIAQENGMTVQQFRENLNRINVPVEALYDKIETDIAWSQVVRRKLRPQVSISENDIDAVFDDMKRTEGKTQYRVAEIFVASKGLLEGNDESKAKIENLMQQIVNGGSFPDIAKRHSESAAASRGGDLGWLTLQQLDKAFQPVVLKMQPGQVSPPVQSNSGYHILLLIDVKEPQAPQNTSQADQTANKQVSSDTESSKLRLQQIFIPVSESEPADVRAAKMARATQLKTELGNCDDMRGRFADFDSPLTGDLGYVDVADLPPTINAAISDLPAGELSKPMVNARGIFLLMVCERQSASTPAPEDIGDMEAESRDNERAREQVANQLGMRKLEGLQQRYLRDLRAAAFIDRRL